MSEDGDLVGDEILEEEKSPEPLEVKVVNEEKVPEKTVYDEIEDPDYDDIKITDEEVKNIDWSDEK